MMQTVLLFALAATYFSGISVNGFAVAVNLWDWRFKGDLKASDYYLCSVALSNLSVQLLLGFMWFCDDGWNYGTVCQITFALNMISTHYSILQSGVMCWFYCFKIAGFTHWLLQKYSRWYLESHKHIIFRAILLSTALGLPLFWMKKTEPSTSSDSSFFNLSSFSNLYNLEVEEYFEVYKMFVLVVGYTFPVLLSLVAAGRITLSLMKHMKRMRGTMEKQHGVLIEAHRRAAITVLSLLVLILVHFVTSVIILMEVFPKQDFRSTLCKVISSLYAPMLGIVFVKGNSRLWSVIREITRKLTGTIKLQTSKKGNNPSMLIR